MYGRSVQNSFNPDDANGPCTPLSQGSQPRDRGSPETTSFEKDSQEEDEEEGEASQEETEEECLKTPTRQASTIEYLPGMIHTGSPAGLLPKFPSWSLISLGKYSNYSPNVGERLLR